MSKVTRIGTPNYASPWDPGPSSMSVYTTEMSNFDLVFIVNQMAFNKTRRSCPWNNVQKLYTKLSQGLVGVKGVRGGGLGVVGMRVSQFIHKGSLGHLCSQSRPNCPVPQGEDHMNISLICMSLLYDTPS